MENLSIDEITYKKYVVELADSESPKLISNGDVSHARILIRQLLLRGDEKIRIFSGYLKDIIYSEEDIIESLKAFLEKPNTELKILLQSPEEDSTFKEREFYKVCKGKKNCEIRVIPEGSELKDMKAHFITMDKKSYRFCADRTNFKAVASFNRPKIVEKLNEIFDELFTKSKPMQESVS